MGKRWLLYISILIGCLAFHFGYGGWFSLLTVIGAGLFPLVSLALSLPRMLSATMTVRCAPRLSPGSRESVGLVMRCRSVVPPYRYTLEARSAMTGRVVCLREDSLFPTAHCGGWVLRVHHCRVYDDLGLFFRRLPPQTHRISVVPAPAEPDSPPELEQYVAASWKPKRGGGFSENHELRLYRPGDSMNQIHWKLSAKTGKVIIREPMLPASNTLRLDLLLSGTPEEVDRKLAELTGMMQYLLRRGLTHEVRALTGEDTVRFRIAAPEDAERCLQKLLFSPLWDGPHGLEPEPAAWVYEIGGNL